MKRINEADDIIIDVLNQACGNGEGEIDNRCTSAYERACRYLHNKGLLIEVNSRMYNIPIEIWKEDYEDE